MIGGLTTFQPTRHPPGMTEHDSSPRENAAEGEMRSAFSAIFDSAAWDETRQSRSGPGSWPALTAEYRQILQDVLRSKAVRSVVDVGCGDWASSREIDWTGISYVGVDVVPAMINSLNATYGTEQIRFICADVVNAELPRADLAIVKDVMQHWPNEAIHSLLRRLPQFRYALITNDRECTVPGDWKSLWRRRRLGELNSDIAAGGWRPLDLRAAPFGLKAAHLKTLKMPFAERVFVKEVLLWENGGDGGA